MRFRVVLAALSLTSCAFAQGADSLPPAYGGIHFPVYSRTGMVAAQDEAAARVGAQILAEGGNAVDAAVAVGFALAVTLPRAGNIGGGGFMLVFDGKSGQTTAIDYREMAPQRATRDMFVDAAGNADRELALNSHESSGVPGTVAGLYLAHEKFGRLPWRRLLEPAIALARDGFVVSFDQAAKFASSRDRLCRQKASCTYFFKPGGVPYAAGERLVQTDLAHTLQVIADEGAQAFYQGEIADRIVAEMDAGGGLVDKASLAEYRPILRDPVRGRYRGYEIVAMPPPSSGGVHVIQMLNILEHFPLAEFGQGSADEVHVLTEVMRLAYADRSKHLGDPAFYDVPVDWLTSKEYAARLAKTIDMKQARRSSDVLPGKAPADESMDTTHFSVIDIDGNVVSNTYTLNLTYGSGISVPGAGFLLNDEMDDFVSKPGVPNAYGLLGGEANAIAADKRPLSSMTPVIVFADGKPWFATGSPNGSRIITAVLQMIVNVIDYRMNIADATDRPRMHHQWWPDVLLLEDGYSPDTIRLLEARGHDVKLVPSLETSLQTVAVENGLFEGASDPRRPDAASVAPAAVAGRGD
jgi:gamma-glutamyltranspeptidase / glutathione hydrolase